ncbi:unnamed protein product [Fraxinus pennsylvanica]|uniref:Uncharacterized protein n=1 Tax=Fraxinus pennsylvanica TaxID=56036 RepID=A0AAD1YWQ6_9LAMI|nr:unnamed protein product [Fraxinus pennsylvanica]
MGTEVLRPQDCLGERFRVSQVAFHNRRKNTKHGEAGYRKPVFRSERSDQNQKKKFNNQHENSISKKSSSADSLKFRSDNGPVMGQVTILRRGESLDSLNPKINSNKKLGSPKRSPVDDMVVYGTERIGPDTPEMAPMQIRLVAQPASARRGGADTYAGSAFSTSPSPRSLPVPSFFNKKKQDSARQVFDDSATRDLRRLLRLE